MRKSILEVNNLCVDFLLDEGEFRAVDHVSFNIGRGEIFGLAGESGCGKSTIAFAITQLLQSPAYISMGEILFDGSDMLKMTEESLIDIRWKRVSIVLQSAMNSLNPMLNIKEQFRDMFFCHLGLSPKESEYRAGELMTLVDIDPVRLDDYPHQLSGGMRQRISIAIALALKPEFVVLDEPTTALDVVLQRSVLQKIYQLNQRYGFSILFISHDLSLMAQFCDRIGIMHNGRLVEVNTTSNILQQPQHPYTKKLWQAVLTPLSKKSKLACLETFIGEASCESLYKQ